MNSIKLNSDMKCSELYCPDCMNELKYINVITPNQMWCNICHRNYKKITKENIVHAITSYDATRRNKTHAKDKPDSSDAQD